MSAVLQPDHYHELCSWPDGRAALIHAVSLQVKALRQLQQPLGTHQLHRLMTLVL